jgi:hypothetical protein
MLVLVMSRSVLDIRMLGVANSTAVAARTASTRIVLQGSMLSHCGASEYLQAQVCPRRKFQVSHLDLMMLGLSSVAAECDFAPNIHLAQVVVL